MNHGDLQVLRIPKYQLQTSSFNRYQLHRRSMVSFYFPPFSDTFPVWQREQDLYNDGFFFLQKEKEKSATLKI